MLNFGKTKTHPLKSNFDRRGQKKNTFHPFSFVSLIHSETSINLQQETPSPALSSRDMLMMMQLTRLYIFTRFSHWRN